MLSPCALVNGVSTAVPAGLVHGRTLSILLEPITLPVLDDPASQKAPLLDYIYRVGTGIL